MNFSFYLLAWTLWRPVASLKCYLDLSTTPEISVDAEQILCECGDFCAEAMDEDTYVRNCGCGTDEESGEQMNVCQKAGEVVVEGNTIECCAGDLCNKAWLLTGTTQKPATTTKKGGKTMTVLTSFTILFVYAMKWF